MQNVNFLLALCRWVTYYNDDNDFFINNNYLFSYLTVLFGRYY